MIDPRRERAPATRRSNRFRVALAIVASAGFLFVFVFPTSAWWDQRREIDDTERRVELLRAEADALERERDLLADDAVIERIARERFNLVRPGETAWAVVPRPEPPAGDPPEGAPAAPRSPDPVPTDPVPTDPVPTDPVPTDPGPATP